MFANFGQNVTTLMLSNSLLRNLKTSSNIGDHAPTRTYVFDTQTNFANAWKTISEVCLQGD